MYLYFQIYNENKPSHHNVISLIYNYIYTYHYRNINIKSTNSYNIRLSEYPQRRIEQLSYIM